MTDNQEKGLSLHTKILLGLILGAACGVAVNVNGAGFEAWLSTEVYSRPVQVVEPLLVYVLEPVGQIFLRLLLMTVIPLVFASLAVGVANLGGMGNLGRVGAKTIVYFLLTTALAATIGLTLVHIFQPGAGLPADTRDNLLETYSSRVPGQAGRAGPPGVLAMYQSLDKGKVVETGTATGGFGVQTFVNIVPTNPLAAAVNMDMLAVIFFALLIGIGLTQIEKERAKGLLAGLQGLGDIMVVIINIAMRLAPYGVFALIFATTARFGFDLLQRLGLYVFVVLLGLAIHMFIGFSLLVWFFSRMNPRVFFRKVRNVIITAFSTSSSNATLPTSIKTAQEELGVPPQIAGFVLPLGATMNMNGTALFEGVTVLFLAQVFLPVPLDLTQQVVVVVLCVITAVGAAGVPGGSLPLMMLVLASVNVPPAGIAIIIGVDRLLDMCRTTLNVVGDITCATYITRSEGLPLKDTG